MSPSPCHPRGLTTNLTPVTHRGSPGQAGECTPSPGQPAGSQAGTTGSSWVLLWGAQAACPGPGEPSPERCCPRQTEGCRTEVPVASVSLPVKWEQGSLGCFWLQCTMFAVSCRGGAKPMSGQEGPCQPQPWLGRPHKEGLVLTVACEAPCQGHTEGARQLAGQFTDQGAAGTLTPRARAAPLPGPALERPPPSHWDLLCAGVWDQKDRGQATSAPLGVGLCSGKGGGTSGLTLGSWHGQTWPSLHCGALQGPGHSPSAHWCPRLRPVAVAGASRPPARRARHLAVPTMCSPQPWQGRLR